MRSNLKIRRRPILSASGPSRAAPKIAPTMAAAATSPFTASSRFHCSAISGLAHIGSTSFGPGLYPSWYFAISAAAYGLILPVIASLHVRHQLVRQSGAVLGTIAGASVVTLGLGAAANPDLIPGALFVRGVWWWTIGKLWAETGVLPRAFGWITMALAVLCFALVIAYAIAGLPMSPPDLPLRIVLGAWLVALGAIVWRDSRTTMSR